MVHPYLDGSTVGLHLDHRAYSTAIRVVVIISDQGFREARRSVEAANVCVQQDRVGPQHVRLKVHRGFATLLNDFLQPAAHILLPVLVPEARAVAEMRVQTLVESIAAYPTEAEHAEVVELHGLDAISPELLDVPLVILATELLVGLVNIVVADLHAHRRFCNTPFRLHRGCSRFGGQIDAPSSE